MTLLVFAVVLYLTVTVKAQECRALAHTGDCDFYSQCVESRFQCITNEYSLACDDRYCCHITKNCFTSEVSVHCFLFNF